MGMATLAVEPTMLRYQMAIVSRTVGCSSFTNLRGKGGGVNLAMYVRMYVCR